MVALCTDCLHRDSGCTGVNCLGTPGGKPAVCKWDYAVCKWDYAVCMADQ